MGADEIKKYLASLCSHLTFEFEGKSCGVDPLAEDQFDMWCGDNAATVNSIEAVMKAPFFDGKCLREIANKIQNIEM